MVAKFDANLATNFRNYTFCRIAPSIQVGDQSKRVIFFHLIQEPVHHAVPLFDITWR